MNYDIIVVGSGPGGYVTAIRASQLGLKTAIVEREELGGICLNWGCIPTKALLKSANVFEYLTHASDYGITVKEATADFGAMIKRSRDVAHGMSNGIQFLMKKNKVNFFEPGPAWVIVQKLTTEIIHEAVEAYMNDRPDGYQLKLSYFGNDIDISVFDQLQAEEVKQSKKYNVIRGLDELKDKINKIAKLDQDSFKKEQSDILANLNELYQFLDSKPLQKHQEMLKY